MRLLLATFPLLLLHAQPIPYTVADAPWNDELGNHRARIHVEAPAAAVRVQLPWRRHDAGALSGPMVVFPAAPGPQIRDVLVLQRTTESADVIFAPAPNTADYFVYYMPHTPADPHPNASTPPLYASLQPDPGWAARYGAQGQQLPTAQVTAFEARTQFDSFYPMEVAATAAEVRTLRAQHPNQPYLLFPEDRLHPIKMTDYLPLRWTEAGPSARFEGTAQRNEFYVFQIGIYSITATGPAAVATTPETVHCLNPSVNLTPGRVTAVWCGAAIPLIAKPGPYEAAVTIRPASAPAQTAAIHLDVTNGYVRDGGVDDPTRLSRLKWLDSTLGTEDVVTKPYTPLQVTATTVQSLGRRVALAPGALPSSIRSADTEMLAAPIRLRPYQNGAPVALIPQPTRLVSQSAATAIYESESRNATLTLRTRATAEFDGGLGFAVDLTATQPTNLSDVVLDIAIPKSRAPYIAGMGLNGGKRPAQWSWKFSDRPPRWAEQGINLEYFAWLGGPAAGLYLRIKSPLTDWEAAPESGITLTEEGPNVVLRARSGPRRLAPGESAHYNFRLLPTPVKPLPTDPFAVRYAHDFHPISEVAATGATVFNIHHAEPPNQWINYPFLNLDLLVPYVQEAHRAGLKVKLYYTIRELTTRLPELWAFRSLGDEIYRVGGVQGHGRASLDYWLHEHLVSEYAAAWVTRVAGGEIDAAIRTRPVSRLNNFYVEGLKWLAENVQIDGIYLDEIGYPREQMQRVRRALDAARPGSLIDLHGNRDWWSCNSPVGYYLEHLPYIDQLWFGEAFNSDWPPDFWLVEMSGIPFGLYGEMLQNPNPWRGLLFGMTARQYYSGASPTPIWNIMKGVTKMQGWWDPNCPVKTNRDDVLATVYRANGKTLIAIASWAKEPAQIKLVFQGKIQGRLVAEAIQDFQSAATYNLNGPIPIEPGKGLLLEMPAQ